MSFENIEPILKAYKEWDRIYWLAHGTMMPSHWSLKDRREAYDKCLSLIWNTFDCDNITDDFELASREHLRNSVVSNRYKISKTIKWVGVFVPSGVSFEDAVNNPDLLTTNKR